MNVKVMLNVAPDLPVFKEYVKTHVTKLPVELVQFVELRIRCRSAHSYANAHDL